MAIIWSAKLSTGLDWQDNEHKELFARMDSLLEAMKRQDGRNELDGLFKFLEVYMAEHFGHEERYMQTNNFPKARAHKAMHEDFVARCRELKLLYGRQGASSYVVMSTQRWLAEWLLQHISYVDKEMAAYVARNSSTVE